MMLKVETDLVSATTYFKDLEVEEPGMYRGFRLRTSQSTESFRLTFEPNGQFLSKLLDLLFTDSSSFCVNFEVYSIENSEIN